MARRESDVLRSDIVLNEVEYGLLRKLGGSEVVKDRYVLLYAGTRYGIDVFHGHLARLVLAEVECQTKQQALSLPLPPFAWADVTDDAAFTGGALAAVSGECIQSLLASRIAGAG